MATRSSVLGLIAGAALFGAVPGVYAQAPLPATEKFFVNVNLGGQLADHDSVYSVEKPIYDETATLNATQPIGKGMTFDFGGGYRVYEDVYAALVISRFSNTHAAAFSASIPHPSQINVRKTVTGNTDELHRSEVAFNPHAIWVRPLTDKIDVAVGLGLSIIKVTQDVLSDFTVPAPTQDVIVTPVEESGTATGIYVAADFIYGLTPRYGAGAFIRYAGGKADLPTFEDVEAGGFQIGAGIRLRF